MGSYQLNLQFPRLIYLSHLPASQRADDGLEEHCRLDGLGEERVDQRSHIRVALPQTASEDGKLELNHQQCGASYPNAQRLQLPPLNQTYGLCPPIGVITSWMNLSTQS